LQKKQQMLTGCCELAVSSHRMSRLAAYIYKLVHSSGDYDFDDIDPRSFYETSRILNNGY